MNYKQTIEQAQQPKGTILFNNPIYEENAVPKFYTENGVKICDWKNADVVTSKDTILCDKSGSVKVGFCRFCKNKIKPYTEKFYQKEYSFNAWYSRLYCADNFYCRECAIKETETVKDYGRNRDIDVIKVETIFRDDQEVIRKTYRDGSVIEDMTEKEKANDSYFKAMNK